MELVLTVSSHVMTTWNDMLCPFMLCPVVQWSPTSGVVEIIIPERQVPLLLSLTAVGVVVAHVHVPQHTCREGSDEGTERGYRKRVQEEGGCVSGDEE